MKTVFCRFTIFTLLVLEFWEHWQNFFVTLSGSWPLRGEGLSERVKSCFSDNDERTFKKL